MPRLLLDKSSSDPYFPYSLIQLLVDYSHKGVQISVTVDPDQLFPVPIPSKFRPKYISDSKLNPWNLTAGCLDPASAFLSPYSLYQCFQVFLRPENFEDWEGNYLASNDTIGPNTTFGTMIGECLQQYCLQPDPGLGGCDYTTFFWPTDGYSMFPHPYPMFSSPACSRISLTVNQDLCGPGVCSLISHIKSLPGNEHS